MKKFVFWFLVFAVCCGLLYVRGCRESANSAYWRGRTEAALKELNTVKEQTATVVAEMEATIKRTDEHLEELRKAKTGDDEEIADLNTKLSQSKERIHQLESAEIETPLIRELRTALALQENLTFEWKRKFEDQVEVTRRLDLVWQEKFEAQKTITLQYVKQCEVAQRAVDEAVSGLVSMRKEVKRLKAEGWVLKGFAVTGGFFLAKDVVVPLVREVLR